MSAPMPTHYIKEYLFIFSFGMFRNVDFCFGSFRNGSETPKQIEKSFFSFAKQTETELEQINIRFVSVQTETKKFCFEDTLVLICKVCIEF
jgi:hypothetical protein